MLALIRAPVEFGLTLGKGALGVGLGAVRAARDLVVGEPGDDRYSVVVPPTPPPRPPARPPAPEPAAPQPPAPEPVVEAPPPPVEDHVSEEPVQVAEFAEPGAEDGPGPELEVDEPWEGYARLDARSIADQLAAASAATAGAVELYESTHRGRRTVLAATERRLKALSAGPATHENR